MVSGGVALLISLLRKQFLPGAKLSAGGKRDLENSEVRPKVVRRSVIARTAKLCPNCLSPLTRNSKLGGWLLPQDYKCAKCEYQGYAYLESVSAVGTDSTNEKIPETNEN